MFKNPYAFGTLENTIYWGFYGTDNSLVWLVKYTAGKHKLTQKQVKAAIEVMFTEDERIQRGNRIIKNRGLDLPQRRLPSQMNKNIDSEYRKIINEDN
ncbi:MAG: hypothetical protein IBX57_00515 [Gammaproteobacteria bacterium]|nr:hypothetical protein [Gammaproteobacteria bacterium]